MRPKARGLVQHGCPSGWLEDSDQAGCDIVRDGRSMPLALTNHTACPGRKLLSCEPLAIPAAAAAGFLLNVHKQPTWLVITHGVPRHFSTNTCRLPGSVSCTIMFLCKYYFRVPMTCYIQYIACKTLIHRLNKVNFSLSYPCFSITSLRASKLYWLHLICFFKGTVLRDRFRKCWRKLTDLGLNKGRGWFLNFSEGPLIFGWNKTSSFR